MMSDKDVSAPFPALTQPHGPCFLAHSRVGFLMGFGPSAMPAACVVEGYCPVAAVISLAGAECRVSENGD